MKNTCPPFLFKRIFRTTYFELKIVGLAIFTFNGEFENGYAIIIRIFTNSYYKLRTKHPTSIKQIASNDEIVFCNKSFLSTRRPLGIKQTGMSNCTHFFPKKPKCAWNDVLTELFAEDWDHFVVEFSLFFHHEGVDTAGEVLGLEAVWPTIWSVKNILKFS